MATPSIPKTLKPLFVSCLKGLESTLVKELKKLGIEEVKMAHAGAFIPRADLAMGQLICYSSRLAMRVLWQIHSFTIWKPQNLYQQLVKQAWNDWLVNPDKSLKSLKIGVSGRCRHFPNTHFVAQRAKDAICDQMRQSVHDRPDIEMDNPQVRLQIHLEEEQITLYYDLSGAPLNQRGYRFESGLAPLNEVLAASLLTLAGYDGYRPFCDPCCGSGTLLMEAAMIAAHVPAGYFRQEWGFMHHYEFDPEKWQAIRLAAHSAITALGENWIMGIDQDIQSIKRAQKSWQLGHKALQWPLPQLYCQPFIETSIQGRYFVLTNPPFNIRLKDGNLHAMYRQLGQFLVQHASRAFIFSADEELLQASGLEVLQKFHLFFGAHECQLQRLKVISSSASDCKN